MKADSLSFKDAVVFYLNKHKTPDKIIANYIKTGDDDQIEVFENAIEQM